MHKIALASIWIFIFTIPWQRMIMVPGVGTISRAVGLFIFCIVGIVTLYYMKFRIQTLHLLMLIFGAWAGLTYLWSVDPDQSQIAILSYAQILVMVLIIYQWVKKVSDVNAIFLAYVMGCWVSVGGAIFAHLHRVNEYYYRISAYGFNQNDLAVILALGIPMSWFLSLNTDKNYLIIFYRIYPLAALFAILLTASRGGFIVAMIGILYVLATYTKLSIRSKVILPVVITIALIASIPYVPMGSVERIGTISNELTEGNMNFRTEIWKSGLRILNDAPLGGLGALWGNGFGSFPQAVAKYQEGIQFSSHNVYLSVLIELGVIGFILFAAIFAFVFYIAFRLPSSERIFWVSLLMQWVVAAMALNWLLYKETWLLPGLLVAHAAAMRHEDKIQNQIINN